MTKPNSLERFPVYFEHQESIEAYNELAGRTSKRIALIIAPVIIPRLSK